MEKLIVSADCSEAMDGRDGHGSSICGVRPKLTEPDGDTVNWRPVADPEVNCEL